MSTRFPLILSLILLSILVGCASHKLSSSDSQKPFPSDWTAYPVTQEQALTKWEAYWSDAMTLAKGYAAQDGNDEAIVRFKKYREESDRNWAVFVGKMQPGDELWFFSSSRASWDWLAGREGYAIVRNGKKVDSYITRMN